MVNVFLHALIRRNILRYLYLLHGQPLPLQGDHQLLISDLFNTYVLYCFKLMASFRLNKFYYLFEGPLIVHFKNLIRIENIVTLVKRLTNYFGCQQSTSHNSSDFISLLEYFAIMRNTSNIVR